MVDDANPAPRAKAAKPVPVRVLLAFDGHQPNDVIDLPLDAVASLEVSGHVDSHGDAVAYARSLADDAAD